MTLGLIGKKCGMTRIFSENGSSIPVTVLTVLPNRIVHVKNEDKDGYKSIQVTVGEKKPSKVNKGLAGHYAKANVGAGEGLWEFRLSEEEGSDLEPGKEFKVDLFEVGQEVDVRGVTKGKGFAGVVKRYHFGGDCASHGASLTHRSGGSIGQRQTPGRVFKGKKMAGHMGNVNRTIQSQEIIKIDNERNLIMIKGGVPGAPGGMVVVKPSIKARGKK